MATKQEIMALLDDDVTVRQAAIRAYVMDKSNTYEDRLEVWKKTKYHLAHHNGCVVTLSQYEKEYGEVDWFGSYFERHTIVDLRDWASENTKTPEEARAFNTNCMDEGYTFIELDW